MLHRLKRCKVDVLLFNPPYVPTEEQEESDGQVQADLSAAWAGGTQGMNSTEMLLQAVPVSEFWLRAPRRRWHRRRRQLHPGSTVCPCCYIRKRSRIRPEWNDKLLVVE